MKLELAKLTTGSGFQVSMTLVGRLWGFDRANAPTLRCGIMQGIEHHHFAENEGRVPFRVWRCCVLERTTRPTILWEDWLS